MNMEVSGSTPRTREQLIKTIHAHPQVLHWTMGGRRVVIIRWSDQADQNKSLEEQADLSLDQVQVAPIGMSIAEFNELARVTIPIQGLLFVTEEIHEASETVLGEAVAWLEMKGKGLFMEDMSDESESAESK